jgi:nucleoside-diphosphate-sugar epimerase
MTKILITGGAGNVGSSLARKFLDMGGYYVVVVDNLLTGKRDNLPSDQTCNFQFINCDVNNLNQITSVMTSHRFDFVFHYAAVVGVQRTLLNPIWVLNDIEGIKNVLELSKNTGVKRIFYSSSSEVYGEPVSHPQFEDSTPLNSKLPYAIVKNVGEAFLRSYQKSYGLNYTIFRFFNTYGPQQSQDFVVAKFLKCAINNEDITIFGDGLQTRTLCFIDDNVDSTVFSLINDLGINETINIGNDVEFSILELANVCISITKSSSKIIHLPPLDEGDMSRRRPDIGKMRKILNRPLINLELGIKIMLDSYGLSNK